MAGLTLAFRILEESDGMTVMATMRLNPTPTAIAKAMSRKSCPACSSIKRMGMNTAMVVSVLAKTAPHTSTVPS